MKLIRNMLISALVFIFVGCVLSGCNTNNADYDNDAVIAKQGGSSIQLGSLETAINNILTISYRAFGGQKEIWSATSTNEGSITIDYDLNITQGRFKCVLVSPEGDVTVLFDETSAQTITIDLPQGKSIIKFVGDNAGIKLQITVTAEGDAKIRRLED